MSTITGSSTGIGRSAGEPLPAEYRAVPQGQPARPRNISQAERWISGAAGAVLTLGGLERGRLSGLMMAGLGAGLLYRAFTGHCHCYQALGINTAEHNPQTAVPAQEGVRIEKSVRVNRPVDELFAFWRDVENLPTVMRHLHNVEAMDKRRSHWIAEGPLGATIEWDAEIFNERENELIAWRSLPGGDIETAGSVRFEQLSEGQTAVHVTMKYNPPAGKLGDSIASLLGGGLAQEVAEDLVRFKDHMEGGEIRD